jgi:hypothetical protein
MGGRCDWHCDPPAMLDTEKVDVIPDFTAKAMSSVALFFK